MEGSSLLQHGARRCVLLLLLAVLGVPHAVGAQCFCERLHLLSQLLVHLREHTAEQMRDGGGGCKHR